MINLYHNNRCSKSRAALALLETSGHEFQTINYLDAPPTAETLMRLLGKADFIATDLVRFGDAYAKTLGVAKTDALTNKQWCELLAEHPQMLQRPIVESDNAAAIGRPIDNIQHLLETL